MILNGRRLEPVIARPRRPLSNNASTDSCNIRLLDLIAPDIIVRNEKTYVTRIC